MARRKCLICGKEFNSQHGAIYCSNQCRSVRRSRTLEEYRQRQRAKEPLVKVCPVCGKKFVARGSAVYCSNNCRNESLLKQNSAHLREVSVQARRLRESDKFQCCYCGKEMTKNEIYYADPADEDWIFCSRECAIATFTDKFFKMKEAGIIKDNVINMRICAWCGDPFEVDPGRLTQIYCSKSCGQYAKYAKQKERRRKYDAGRNK